MHINDMMMSRQDLTLAHSTLTVSKKAKATKKHKKSMIKLDLF